MNRLYKNGVLIILCTLILQTMSYADDSVTKLAVAANAMTPTVENAVNAYGWEKLSDMAIKNNVDFQTTEVDKMKLGRQMDDLMNTVNSLQSMGYLTYTDKKDKTDPLVDNITLMRNNREAIDENITLKKEVLRDTIKNVYITIYKYEKQLSSLNEQVKLNIRLLEVDRKKLKLGLISSYDLEKNYNSYQKVERTANSLKTNINKLYTSLKDLAGLDTKSIIILDYAFIDQEPIIPIDYDSGFQRMNSKNLKIEVYTNNVKRAKEFKVGVESRYPSGDSNFEMAKFDYSKAELTLNNAVADLPYKYESAYNLVMDAYESYNQKQKEYDIKRLEMKNTQLKLKIGSASQLEVIAMDTQMKAIGNELLGARLDYVSSKVSLESTIKGTN